MVVRLSGAHGSERGSVLLLATVLTLIAATLLAITVDLATVAWHQRQLAALTDAAALAGAQGLDEGVLYLQGAGAAIPLDSARASAMVGNYFTAAEAPARFSGFSYRTLASDTTVLVESNAVITPPLRGAFTGPIPLTASALATTPIY